MIAKYIIIEISCGRGNQPGRKKWNTVLIVLWVRLKSAVSVWHSFFGYSRGKWN